MRAFEHRENNVSNRRMYSKRCILITLLCQNINLNICHKTIKCLFSVNNRKDISSLMDEVKKDLTPMYIVHYVDTVCPGSSDPPEKISDIFTSENEVYTIF